MDGIVEIIGRAGFKLIGQFEFKVRLTVYWRAEDAVLLLYVPLGQQAIIKGVKAYHLVAIANEARTWMRDLAELQAYLQAHVSDLHLSFSWYRDVSPGLAKQHADTVLGRSISDSQPLEDRLHELREQIRSAQDSNRLLGIEDPLLTEHLRTKVGGLEQQTATVQAEADEQRKQRERRMSLIEGLLRKGSAARLTFSVSSAAHVVGSSLECSDAVNHVGKELADYDHYQITQKLQGSRLRVQYVEASEPEITWLELWLGGSIDPKQLERALDAATNSSLQVYANEDLRIDEHHTEPQACIAPRVVGSLLDRLDPPLPAAPRVVLPRASEMSVTLGIDIESGEPAGIDLGSAGQAIITGTTGSGKSVFMRVLAEEAAQQEGLAILVLDPRNQWVGILQPEDRSEWLAEIERWGGLKPKAFDFRYHAPGNEHIGKTLDDLRELGEARHVVSLASLDDEERCHRAAEVLEAVFDRHAKGEASGVRQLILIEEAQLFTRRRVSEGARSASERAERSIERIYREGRKYGIRCWCATQTLRDFAHTLAGVRQNATTKCLFHNSDREIELAKDALDSPRVLTKLAPGEAMLCNPRWGAIHLRVRPPVSKIWEYDERQTAELVRHGESTAPKPVTREAEQLMETIGRETARKGTGVNVTEIGRAAGITSRRKLVALIGELEGAGRVRTHRLPERGRPRVVELCALDRTDG